MALPPANRPEAKGALAGRLRDIEAVADAAPSRLDEQSLLAALLERVKNVLHADTAAVLLVDHSARQLVATAASGIEEEVRQGVRIPLGSGFAGRVAASRQPDVPGTGLAARYVAGSGNVGGDWYDVFTLPDGKLGIVVGYVAGSGLAAAVIMGRMRSTLRAYILQTADPAQALRLLDRKIQYFEPYAMATVLYGRYDPGTGDLVLCSAGHLPPVPATPAGHPPAMLPFQPGPPIGTADDPERHSTAVTVPPGALLCCFTDGLVERRDQPIDHGISQVAATLGELATAVPGHGGQSVPLAEDACAAVMRALVGNAPAQDDIAVLTLHRHRDAEPDAGLPQRPG